MAKAKNNLPRNRYVVAMNKRHRTTKFRHRANRRPKDARRRREEYHGYAS